MDQKQEEQLERFARIVEAETQRQTKSLLETAQQEAQKTVQEAEQAAAEQAEQLLRQEVSAWQTELRQRRAQAEISTHNTVLEHRKALSEQILETVSQRLVQFANSPAYPEYLRRRLKQAHPSAGSVILLSERDLRFLELMEIPADCQVQADPQIRLGGFSVVDASGTHCFDETFDAAFEEERRVFSKRYHLTLVQEGAEH